MSKFPPEKFNEAAKLWSTGNHTLADLSDRYGVSKVWLSKKFKEAGIEKGSDAKIERQIRNEMLDRAIADANSALKEFVIDSKELPVKFALSFMRKAAFEFKEAHDNGERIGDRYDNIKTIKAMMDILEKGQKICWTSLGLDREENQGEDIPSLHIVEMTDDDVAAERERQIAEEEAFNGKGIEDALLEDLSDEDLIIEESDDD